MVELALVTPVLLLILVGIVGTGFLFEARLVDQNGIEVLVKIAARSPSAEEWRAIVEDENRRTGCNADPLMPELSDPDGTAEPGSRIRATWFCHFRTGWFFDGLPITVRAEAVRP
jgi:Flp pilus assembly protein TadG